MLYLFESVLASLRLLREKDIVKVCVSINVITYLDPLACLFLGLILQVEKCTYLHRANAQYSQRWSYIIIFTVKMVLINN